MANSYRHQENDLPNQVPDTNKIAQGVTLGRVVFPAQALKGRDNLGFYGHLCRPFRTGIGILRVPRVAPWAIVFRSFEAWFGSSFS